METLTKARILKETNSLELVMLEKIQTLWSNYGAIYRAQLAGGKHSSVIVKLVKLPKKGIHPRGWNTDTSHQRKIRSYDVEINWYKRFGKETNEYCTIPKHFGSWKLPEESVLILEDLDSIGYPKRKKTVSLQELNICIKWLANFHAVYMQKEAKELWEVGSYWHLDTRWDEWNQMQDHALKDAAVAINDILNQAKYKTIIHGDAKLANFCFSNAGKRVAAVDFQYVGKGCGMKDFAYLLSSCLDEGECAQYENALLKYYFDSLHKALDFHQLTIDFEELKREWFSLYKYAWADFYRFLDGWSPGHWKINSYNKGLKKLVIEELNNRKFTI